MSLTVIVELEINVDEALSNGTSDKLQGLLDEHHPYAIADVFEAVPWEMRIKLRRKVSLTDKGRFRLKFMMA